MSPTVKGVLASTSMNVNATTRTMDLTVLKDLAGADIVIADGDFLLLWVFYAGNATNTVSGLTGLTKLADVVAAGNGISSTVYYKQNCVSADDTADIVVTFSTTGRQAVFAEVISGASVSGSPFFGTASFSQAATNTARATPTVVTTGAGGIVVQGAAWTQTGQIPTVAPTPDASATVTKSVFSTAVTTGNIAATIVHNHTTLASGATAGGTVFTPESNGANPAGNVILWTLVIAPVAAVTSGRPNSTVSSTGYIAVGSAGSIHASFDSSFTNLVESSDDPAGLVCEVGIPDLTVDALFVWDDDIQIKPGTTGSITYLVQLRQSSTTKASWSQTISDTDGVVHRTLKTTTAEASALTASGGKWTGLSLKYTLTKV